MESFEETCAERRDDTPALSGEPDEQALRVALAFCRSSLPDERDVGFARLRQLFPGVDELELRELVESFQSREEKVR